MPFVESGVRGSMPEAFIENNIMIFSTSRPGLATWTPFALVSAISALVSVDAAAQAAADKTLAPVVVTASRVEQAQTEALPHTTVITAEDIRNNPATDLPSLLRREAGIQWTQNGGLGQTTSLFTRGAPPSHTLILIDGVPVRRQGFATAPALEHILPEQIDHIEIVRGNVSAIYGSGAIGGVIQIFTKQGTGPTKPSITAEVGAHGTRQFTGGVSGQSGATRYAFSLTRLLTDGISANNVNQFPNENPDEDGYRNTSVAANISHEWAKGHEFGTHVYANSGKFSFDGGGSGAPTDNDLGRSKQGTIALFSKNRIAPNWASKVTLSQTATRNENIAESSGGYTTRDNSDTTLLQWTNEVNLSPDWTLVAGVDGGKERLDTFADYGFGGTRADFDRSTSSAYTGLSGTLGMHQLQANMRYDHVEGSGNDLTGFLGYGYALTKHVKLIASASTAFNAPNLMQLFDPLSGNASLESEKSRSYELGAQYAVGATLLRATVFKTRTRNQFAFDPNNCFSGAYLASCPTFNIARGSNEGMELSAGGQIAQIDLRATLTFQDPRNDDTGDRLIRRAKRLASLSVAKAFGPWRVGGDVTYTGDRPDRNFSAGRDVTLQSYWLANLNTRYQVSKSVALFGRVENLFDRDYQTAYGYNQAPRGVFVGVNWQP